MPTTKQGDDEEVENCCMWGTLGVILFIIGFPFWIIFVILYGLLILMDGLCGTDCSECTNMDEFIVGQYYVLRWGCPPQKSDEYKPPEESHAIRMGSQTLAKYVSRFALDPKRCIEAPPTNSDDECFNFAQMHMGKKNIQGMVINSSKVFSNQRFASEEAGVQGMQALSELIRENQDLVVLHLNGHRLDRSTFTVLVESMQNHRSLKLIDLYDNKITGDGGAFIFNNLKDNPVDKLEINLGANDVPTSKQLEIKAILDKEPYNSKMSMFF